MCRHVPSISCVGLLSSLLWLAGPAPAQPSAPPAMQERGTSPPPAHVAFVEGTAWLDRSGQREPAPVSMPLVAGDRLHTELGRVEILFGDGSALYLDHHTTVDLQSEALVRLLAGRLRLVVVPLDPTEPNEPVAFRIDAPSASIEIRSAGDYRVAVVGAPVARDVEVAVLRGEALLATDLGSVQVATGARAVAREGAPPAPPVAFNSARWDAFDRWTEERWAARTATRADAPLPAPLAPYATTLDRYGEWRVDVAYGRVWYPRVAPGWRPYGHGYWVEVAPYGWTWIGLDPWAWPTHHFGRWGFSAGVWFWIPGPRWAPAWVAWAWAPGYVAWCPLGLDGGPVVSLTVIQTVAWRPYPVVPLWHAWMIVPVRVFGVVRGPLLGHAVAVDRLDPMIRTAFAARPAPAVVGTALPRPAVPIRAVGERLRGVGSRTGVARQAVPRADGHAAEAPEPPPSLAALARPGVRRSPVINGDNPGERTGGRPEPRALRRPPLTGDQAPRPLDPPSRAVPAGRAAPRWPVAGTGSAAPRVHESGWSRSGRPETGALAPPARSVSPGALPRRSPSLEDTASPVPGPVPFGESVTTPRAVPRGVAPDWMRLHTEGRAPAVGEAPAARRAEPRGDPPPASPAGEAARGGSSRGGAIRRPPRQR